MTLDSKPAVAIRSDSPRLPPRRSYRPWVTRLLLFGACVVAVESLVGDRGFSKALQARREFARAFDELAVLREGNQRLYQETLRLKHDLRAIEDLARREIGLVKRGEVLVILRDHLRDPPR